MNMDKSAKSPSPEGSERRAAVRLYHSSTIKVTHSSFEEKLLKVRDFSDTGAFIFCNWQEMPPIGSVIEMQVQDLAVTAPWVKAKLVRYESKGVGVVFCD